MQLTWNPQLDHVRQWVLQGEFYDQDSLADSQGCWSSTVVTGLSEAAFPPAPAGSDTTSPSSTSDPQQHPEKQGPQGQQGQQGRQGHQGHQGQQEQQGQQQDQQQWQSLALTGLDNDPLIPRQLDINRVFNNGIATWRQFHHQASALPHGVFPPGLDPAIAMKDMPPLPDSVPQKGVLVGAPTWTVPDPEQREPLPLQPSLRVGRDLDLNQVTGVTKYFRLGYETPLACRVTGVTDSVAATDTSINNTKTSSPSSPAANRFHASSSPLSILTMCWSYIFSTRLLQLQDRKAHYTNSYIRPIPAHCVGPVDADEVVLHLGDSASPRLVHWLCAILAPTPAWAADHLGGEHSPWSASCGAANGVRFVVSTDKQVHLDRKDAAPSAEEALELMLEFCNLYGIRHESPRSRAPQALSPIKAAFLATLAIPFYRMAKLEPQLPRPTNLKPKKVAPMAADETDSIRRYLQDAPYYMTLSMHPYALGPVLWSVFYQPSIDCNLVSPWLTAITEVLSPAIAAQDFELLAKIFCLRRPRVGLWWLGLFLLGSPGILTFIRNYLASLDEGCSYDTLSRPDIVTSIWTGAIQSYQDDTPDAVYTKLSDNVPRAALLQHRHTLTLRDPWPLFYAWRPFGLVPKETIEPDLFPWLERGHQREYQQWTWWSKSDPSYEPVSYPGYRRETRNYNHSVPDRLDFIPSTNPLAPIPSSITINALPSKKATQQMIAHSLGNIVGERSVSTAAIPGLSKSHPWLKDWTPC